MPLAAIRPYAELVHEGPGNEQHRLTVLREHQQRLADQIGALTACLEIINFKVEIYQDSLEAGTADPIWVPSGPA